MSDPIDVTPAVPPIRSLRGQWTLGRALIPAAIRNKNYKEIPFHARWISAVTLMLTKLLQFPLLVLTARLALVQPCAGAPFPFEPTGSLATGRDRQTATLLPNGKVLVAAGSENAGALTSAELYDQAMWSWTTT